MKIVDKKVYTGRNIHSHRLCIKIGVDIFEYVDTETKDIEGFNNKLIKALPGLSSHCCSKGYEGGFLERLNEGTYLPHVFEHSLIEMQLMLGFKGIKYGKARHREGSIYDVVFEYSLEEAASYCIDGLLDCFNSFIIGEDYDMESLINSIEKRISKCRLGASTTAIYDEARRRQIPITRVGYSSILNLGYGTKTKRVCATISDNTSCIAVDISCDKSLTRRILSDISIPIPEGDMAESLSDVESIVDSIGFPLVIKPIDGSKGSGITVNINSLHEARDGYNKAAEINKKVVVERYVRGKDYRLLVINKKVVAASLKLPPYVEGNGVNTIKELVNIENKSPLRGFGHEKPLTKIVLDKDIIMCLASQGKTLDTVLKNSERVFLRRSANLSTGGVSIDCTDKVSAKTLDFVIRAVDAVGLDIAGVDICTQDISIPLDEGGGAILEINAAPGIRMHTHPSQGKPRNVASHMLDYLYKDSEVSIPIVSITGTNGKTTTTRMIGHSLALKGLYVGMTTTSGIYLDGKCIESGDTTGPISARVVLQDKRVEAAVLETARGGILRRGLGYDLADVGVITNITEDHLGLDGVNTLEDLAYVKSLVVEAIKPGGYAVINADDPYVNLISKRVPSDVNITYFSKDINNILIKKHMQQNKPCVFIREDYICSFKDEHIQPIVNIKEIPCTMEGRLVHNVENCLSTVGALSSLNIECDFIEKALKSFLSDSESNPGRFNLYKVNGINVIVDYGHNIDAYNKVIESLESFPSNRRVGVIGVPGDRDDDSIIRLGAIAGEGFDYVYIKEDVDRRGRSEGEVSALLEIGVKLSSKGNNYSIIHKEDEALIEAIKSCSEGDTVVIFYEDLDKVKGAIKSFTNEDITSIDAIS
ncbi:MAG: cyanophycin synthetase [Clostridium sp.]